MLLGIFVGMKVATYGKGIQEKQENWLLALTSTWYAVWVVRCDMKQLNA